MYPCQSKLFDFIVIIIIIIVDCLINQGCDRMNVDQFHLDVPRALERISRDETHETRRYSGVRIID